MATPQLLYDIVNVLLLLAPSAACLCLVLAGISLRREGGGISFVIGGGFTKWMFWAVVFITLAPLLSWFSSFGVGVPLPGGGISTAWLQSFQSDVGSFVSNFVVARLATTVAAFFVLRAILDCAEGANPLPSVVTAMFLLGIQTTYNLLGSYNSGSQYATADVLDSLWTYLAGTIMPVAAGLAIIGAIFNFATQRPALRLLGVALALLSVAAVWRLVLAMMA